MSEIARLLRSIAPAVRELSTQQVNTLAQESGEVFTSGLSEGYSRKKLLVYNQTDAGSGEVYVGESGVTPATGMVLEKAAWLEINIGRDLDVYFVTDDDLSHTDAVNLRVMELA